jgi:uncharacterized protein (UPF0335 family)
MTTITFDTQELVNELESSGFTRKQSETVVSVLKKAQSELVTKDDLHREIRELELRIEVKINEVKYDMVKWIAGMLIAQAGLVAALVKLL